MAASAKKIKTSKERRVKTPAQSHRKPGCKVCRRELESFEKPHLEDVFATQGTHGDLKRTVFEYPTQLASPKGRISYRNDNVLRCKECRALWLTQYWEVVTPENEDEEFGDRLAFPAAFGPATRRYPRRPQVRADVAARSIFKQKGLACDKRADAGQVWASTQALTRPRGFGRRTLHQYTRLALVVALEQRKPSSTVPTAAVKAVRYAETPTRLGHNSFLVRFVFSQVVDFKDGEMLERSIRHAWKAMSWSNVETYRSIFSAAASTT